MRRLADIFMDEALSGAFEEIGCRRDISIPDELLKKYCMFF